MDRIGEVVCPCGCTHRFTVRWPEAPAPTPAPRVLRTSTALAALTPRTALDRNHPGDLPGRIVVWLARRVGARSVDVRRIYHAMHCSAEDCYAALRLLVSRGDVMLFAGPPAMVMLRTVSGALGTHPPAPASATTEPASHAAGTAPACAPASRAREAPEV